MVWAPGIDVADGEIQVDIGGRGVFQKSFPGIACRCATDGACDVVYLRPFNYNSADSTRHAHAIQYTSSPGYPWERLRADSHGGADSQGGIGPWAGDQSPGDFANLVVTRAQSKDHHRHVLNWGHDASMTHPAEIAPSLPWPALP
jgi:hypothetical protein